MPKRSTARYCQDKCRILAFQKKQREEAKKDKKREAKHERRRMLQRLRRNWQAVKDREQAWVFRQYELTCEIDECRGEDQFGKQEKLDQERSAHMPIIERDKRNIERLAARWGFDMEIIKNPPKVNRKPRPEKTRKVEPQAEQPVKKPVEKPTFQTRPSSPMPRVETNRKRVVVGKHGGQKLGLSKKA